MSVVEVIAESRGISLEKAQKVFEAIQAFNEENGIVTENQMGSLVDGMGMGDDFDQGGAPEKSLEGAKDE
ncbi:MAG: hypothetical protein ACRCYA_07585 [Cetobacterium sp.]|uniref:hypothetical protein n=1 Tax=Cetobacterium sp. TaxID=2071632 RepID=UPI003F32D626